MAKKAAPDQELINSITQNLFDVLPMLRKRLLHMDVIQRQFGMPFSNVQVMSLLSDNGAMSISEISHRLGIAKPNTTPLVDRLIQEKMVVRERDMQDRRVVNVHITPEGTQKLTEIRAGLCEQVESWSGDFSRSELKELNRSLGCLIRVIGAVELD